jgi:large subunit ribosomal protein L23Ae
MSGQAEGAAAAVADGQKKKIKKIRHIKKLEKPKKVGSAIPRKYEHQAVKPVSVKQNDYKIIHRQVSSDKVSRKLEEANTITFWVDLRANKKQIARAVQNLYHVKPSKVNTLITTKFLKKAYVKFPQGVEAATIANEMA